MIKLYTIGFTQKNAEEFFGLLKSNSVNSIVDTRINNTSQLAGFAKSDDLTFFAKEIGGMSYNHDVDLAPTKDAGFSERIPCRTNASIPGLGSGKSKTDAVGNLFLRSPLYIVIAWPSCL